MSFSKAPVSSFNETIIAEMVKVNNASITLPLMMNRATKSPAMNDSETETI